MAGHTKNPNLSQSASIIGRLYPVLLDNKGNLIDGQHRLEADPAWPKIRISSIKSEEQRILARLISNVCRRSVSAKEKTETLRELGHIYLRKGVPLSELAHELSKRSGMSYRWVMKYAPEELKLRPGIGGPTAHAKSEVASHATEEYRLLEKSSIKIAGISSYSNTSFATITLEKQFFLRLKRASEELGVDVSEIINNAFLLTLQKTERLAMCKKKLDPRHVLEGNLNSNGHKSELSWGQSWGQSIIRMYFVKERGSETR